jgi:hypothetical protein
LKQGLFARESDGYKKILDCEVQVVMQGSRGAHWLQKIAKNQTPVSREGARRMENGAAGVPV